MSLSEISIILMLQVFQCNFFLQYCFAPCFSKNFWRKGGKRKNWNQIFYGLIILFSTGTYNLKKKKTLKIAVLPTLDFRLQKTFIKLKTSENGIMKNKFYDCPVQTTLKWFRIFKSKATVMKCLVNALVCYSAINQSNFI